MSDVKIGRWMRKKLTTNNKKIKSKNTIVNIWILFFNKYFLSVKVEHKHLFVYCVKTNHFTFSFETMMQYKGVSVQLLCTECVHAHVWRICRGSCVWIQIRTQDGSPTPGKETKLRGIFHSIDDILKYTDLVKYYNTLSM